MRLRNQSEQQINIIDSIFKYLPRAVDKGNSVFVKSFFFSKRKKQWAMYARRV